MIDGFRSFGNQGEPNSSAEDGDTPWTALRLNEVRLYPTFAKRRDYQVLRITVCQPGR